MLLFGVWSVCQSCDSPEVQTDTQNNVMMTRCHSRQGRQRLRDKEKFPSLLSPRLSFSLSLCLFQSRPVVLHIILLKNQINTHIQTKTYINYIYIFFIYVYGITCILNYKCIYTVAFKRFVKLFFYVLKEVCCV